MAKMVYSGVKGMNDMLPQDAHIWQMVEKTAAQLLGQYGYQEIRTPILEHTPLFTRGVGEVTDIVEKEMYSFVDSMNGDPLTLRPEGTSAVVRSVNEHNLLYGQTQRLWYTGPMFRHERPQRGRYRQFHQFGAEVLGVAGPEVDAEMIIMLDRLWKALGVAPVALELNTLGNNEERAKHREALIQYFEANMDVLDETAKRRLYTNPLRILDTKNPDMKPLVEAAPVLTDFLGEESRAFFNRMLAILDAAGVAYTVNPRLVRGLDYYNHTVFEFITDRLGAQSTICGGGRYDPLIEMLGGKPNFGVGFAFGMERVIELMRECGVVPTSTQTDLYLCHTGGDDFIKALLLAEDLRNVGLRVLVHPSEQGLKGQMKKADQSGAQFVVFVTGDELAQGAVGVKALRAGQTQFATQTLVPLTEVVSSLQAACRNQQGE